MATRATSLNNLSVSSLYKRYRGSKKYALEDVTFSLSPGTITGVLGHNGAGKSTLLGSIVGSVKVSSGRVDYGGENLTESPRRAREICAFMPQSYVPLTGVTPAEALSCVTGMRGLPSSRGEAYVHEFMEALDISEYMDIPGDKLSGGYHRLVSLGMAVVQHAKVILLDEPTNDVDPIRRKLLWTMLRQLADQGSSILVVTHNLEEIQAVADTLLVFDQGHLLVNSTPQDFAALSELTYFTVNGNYPRERLLRLPLVNIQHNGNDIVLSCPKSEGGIIMQHLAEAFREDESLTFSVSQGTIQEAYEQLVGKETESNINKLMV